MKVHRFIAATAASLAMAIGLSVVAAEAASAAPVRDSARSAATVDRTTVPVTGTFTNSAGPGTFTGTFTPQRFTVAGQTLEATGLLTGTLVDANGTALGTVSRTVTMPVSAPGAASPAGAANAAADPPSCGILNLVLGPLDLNLLGLAVHLNQVVLNITAIPGAGNLLGNLLCAVANLLNGGGTLSTLLNQLTALLNQILALL